jgi:hypothetical protein
MSDILSVQPDDLHLLRGRDGRPFAELMQSLLLAEALSAGINAASIEVSLRTTLPDGGVDARVREAAPGAVCGWFDVPTVWQFKGTNADNSGRL